MILTVTPNPALDITWHVELLRPGETHRVPTGTVRAGGKGINTARVLEEAGHPACALTLGDADGRFAADLVDSGLRHELVPIRGRVRRSAAIVDESSGEATVLNEPGPTLTAAETQALADATLRLGAEADVVSIAGSLPGGLTPGHLGSLVAALVGTGVATVVDTSGPGLLEAARAGATALKPNREELVAATGLADPLSGARLLLDAGAGIVMVSLGADGLFVLSRRGGVRARLGRVLHGNPTGAGDAAVGAICAALAEAPAGRAASVDLAALARRAVAWSASAVQMPTAGCLGPDRVAFEAETVLTPIEEHA